jgi:hypothetical protein
MTTLKLVATKTLGTGVVVLSYQPSETSPREQVGEP